MNIKQTADASGVSARNIRYYEQAGLLAPARNPENDYRIYTDADVRTLKLIRVLRTLDMPVEDIRAVLSGSVPLSTSRISSTGISSVRSTRISFSVRTSASV